ncbi:MAG TPA: acetyl-CoA carboxylase biotin carboxyl carrier protein [Candidatus Acidoferrales bacterium]
MADSKKARSNNPAEAGSVDLQDLEPLLAFMSKHGLEEFEYERGGFRVRLKKASQNSATIFRPGISPEIVIATQGAASSAPQAAGAREAAGDAARPDDLHVVKSPIVGTFYASPNPGEEAFVRVGDRVKSGQVLCIIEAMKLMNEIESDVDGEVMRIYVENGQPVEYGEALFGIHPQRKK